MKRTKARYYVILHRPVGSKTWTPLPEGAIQMNFFASKSSCINEIVSIVQGGYGCFLTGPCRVVGVEMAVGRVELESSVIYTAQPGEVALAF